eukprot:2624075-Prymnesium_polylepis.1
MDEGVVQIVDDVLASVPELLRNQCDRDGIVAGLLSIGIRSVELLRSMLDEDYATVKAAVISSSKPSFVAMLKSTLRSLPAPTAAATPAGADPSFETPGGARPAS